MNKKISKAFLRIIIFVLTIAVVFGALFVFSKKRYIFDFEGRVKALEKVAQIQKEYPNATVLIPDDNGRLPKSVPAELSYPKAKLASLEQLASQGISYVLLSSDAQTNIKNNMTVSLENAGWELITKSEDNIEAKKGLQKAKISLETEEDQTIILVAYTYNL